jgi:hypothetical protein
MLTGNSLTQKNHFGNRPDPLSGAVSLLNLGDVCSDEQIELDLWGPCLPAGLGWQAVREPEGRKK